MQQIRFNCHKCKIIHNNKWFTLFWCYITCYLRADYFLLLKVVKTLTGNTEKKIEITYVLHTVSFEYQPSLLSEGVKKDLRLAF